MLSTLCCPVVHDTLLQEEALIEADNKAHMKAWQEQLADMKARQAAAVAAAKAEPTPAQARKGGMPRPASTSQLGRADTDGWEVGGTSGKSSKKRSYAAAHYSEGGWDDDEDDEPAEDGRYAFGSAAGGSSKGAPKAARLAAGSSRGPSGGSKRSEFAAAAGDEAGGGDGGLGYAGMSSGGLAKKKKRPGVSVARLIGLAAQQAAAEGSPPRFCVVHLQQDLQEGQLDATVISSVAAEAAGRPEGHSRKQPKAAGGKGKAANARQPLHHLAPGQVATPSIDRPFLACPMACTVAELKKMVLQQLLQQGTTANLKGNFELQLVIGQQQGLLGGSSCGTEDSRDVLQDTMTVAHLHEQGGCLGPDVRVQYRLVGA
jgi:hypothetical protein